MFCVYGDIGAESVEIESPVAAIRYHLKGKFEILNIIKGPEKTTSMQLHLWFHFYNIQNQIEL